jgi:hypothetical protein
MKEKEKQKDCCSLSEAVEKRGHVTFQSGIFKKKEAGYELFFNGKSSGIWVMSICKKHRLAA